MRHIKSYKNQIIFGSIFGLIQLMILLLNFNSLNLLYLVLINGIYSLYLLRKINKFVLPAIIIIGFCLSVYLSGAKFSQNIFNDPSYIESINQLRGGSDFVGKIFYNKLTYGYFYLKSFAHYLDFYFWVERLGFVIFVLALVSIYSLVKKFKRSFLIPLLYIVPIGFLLRPLDSMTYLLFVPILSFLITLFLVKQKNQFKYVLIALIVVGSIIQFIWPIKIIL